MDNFLQLSKNKFFVDDFYEVVGSQFNLGKKIAIRILSFLEWEGHIQIIWHSPRGAYFLHSETPQHKRSIFSENSTQLRQKCSQLGDQPSVVSLSEPSGVKPHELGD